MPRPDDLPDEPPTGPGTAFGRSAPDDRARRARKSDEPEVVSITSAAEPRGDEQSRRMRVYVIQMIIRVICFVAAVFVTYWPVRIVLIAGAVVLPYTAVIFANASGERRSSAPASMEYRELPAAPAPPAQRIIDVPPPEAAGPAGAGPAERPGPSAPPGDRSDQAPGSAA